MTQALLLPRGFDGCAHRTVLPRAKIALPVGVALARGRVHEVMGTAADGFVGAVAGLTAGPVIWIGRARDVYSLCPAALCGFFDPARLITTEGLTRQEILWAGEQALRSKGAGCVIIELSQGPSLRESRRLQIAAEEGGGIGLIRIEKGAQSSAATTRWICDPLPRNKPANDHIWRWELAKHKGGPPGVWAVRKSGTNEGGQDAAYHVDRLSAASA